MIRIVLVNPDTTIQRNFSKWLRRLHPDISILKAAHGQEAWDWLETASAHLVMTGLSMPVLDGFELLARLSGKYSSIPTIIFSENTETTESADPRKVSRIGPYVFLRPPFEYSSTVAALRMALDERPTTPINPLASFVRLLKNERKTCTVTVSSSEKTGQLHFHNGVLIEATADDIQGEPAVFSLFAARDSTFSIGTLVLSEGKLAALSDHPLNESFASGLRSPSAPPSPAFTPPRPPLEKWREYATTTGGPLVGSKNPTESALSSGGMSHRTAQETADSFLNFADVLLTGDSDLDRVYEVVPELRLRLSRGELPQQTAALLNLFDGQSSLRGIIQQVPNQTSALRFLVSGLASANLMKVVPPAAEPVSVEAEPPTAPVEETTVHVEPAEVPVHAEPAVSPSPAEEPVDRAEPAAMTVAEGPVVPEPMAEAISVRHELGEIPAQPYFLSSDAILLAQTLAIKFGTVPRRTSVALWALPQSRQAVLEQTLHHLRATQLRHLNLADPEEEKGPGEIGRLPFRAGLELTVHAFPNQVQTAQRIPELDSFLATIVFLDGERSLSSDVINRLWVEYSTHFDKPCLFNLFNQAFDVQPAIIDHFAASLDLPTTLFGSWDIANPTQVSAMFARLIQVGMIF